MKNRTWKPYVAWILLAEAVGLLAGCLTREAAQIYSTVIEQPPLSPPAIVFPIVWSILYALMGVGAARVYLSPAASARTRSLLLFLVQLLFNFLWSIIFFNLQAVLPAFFWLLILCGLILWMIVSFYRVDRSAAQLQIPYLLWVIFAGYLNLGVWLLNESLRTVF